MRALGGRMLGGVLAVSLALVTPPAGAEPAPLEWSQVDSTVQAENGAIYALRIAWPQGHPPAGGWPVLWVLDGESYFATACQMAGQLAEAGAQGGIEPGLIVGVDSGPLAQRVLDYTPPAQGYAIPDGMPAHGHAVGGADAFLDLLEGPLRAQVASRWPIDPERQTLAGHSFSGLLVLHALGSGRAFSGYAAVSPSLWYADGRLAARATIADPRAWLLLAEGTAMRNRAQRDPTMRNSGTPHAAAEALAERLRASGGTVEYLALEGHRHGTTMRAAMGAAVEAAFGRGAK